MKMEFQHFYLPLIFNLLIILPTYIYYYRSKNNYPRLRARSMLWMTISMISLYFVNLSFLFPHGWMHLIIIPMFISPQLMNMLDLYLKTKLNQTIAASMFDPAVNKRKANQNQKKKQQLMLQHQARSSRLARIHLTNNAPNGDSVVNANEASKETIKQRQFHFYVRLLFISLLFVLPLIVIFVISYTVGVDDVDYFVDHINNTNLYPIATMLSSTGLYTGLGLVIYLLIIAFYLYYLVNGITDLFGIIPEIRCSLFMASAFILPAFIINVTSSGSHVDGVTSFYLVNASIFSSELIIFPYQVLLARNEGEYVNPQLSDMFAFIYTFICAKRAKRNLKRRKSKETRPEIEMTLLLQDPSGVKLFEKYLVSEFCVELLKFHMQVQALKARWDGMDEANRQDWAFDIFERFIIDDSPMQVNIGDDTRTKITEIFFPSHDSSLSTSIQSPKVMNLDTATPGTPEQSPADRNRTRSVSTESIDLSQSPRVKKARSSIYDVADAEVCKLLRVGPFERFSRTADYKEWLAKKNAPLSATLSTAFGSLKTMSVTVMNSIGTPNRLSRKVSNVSRPSSQGMISPNSQGMMSPSSSRGMISPTSSKGLIGVGSGNLRLSTSMKNISSENVVRVASSDGAGFSASDNNHIGSPNNKKKFAIDGIDEAADDDDVAVVISDVNDKNLM